MKGYSMINEASAWTAWQSRTLASPDRPAEHPVPGGRYSETA